MKRLLLIAAVLVMTPWVASADNSMYCDVPAKDVPAKCRAGDILILAKNTSVARLCTFEREIATGTDNYVICVYRGGERNLRSNPYPRQPGQ